MASNLWVVTGTNAVETAGFCLLYKWKWLQVSIFSWFCWSLSLTTMVHDDIFWMNQIMEDCQELHIPLAFPYFHISTPRLALSLSLSPLTDVWHSVCPCCVCLGEKSTAGDAHCFLEWIISLYLIFYFIFLDKEERNKLVRLNYHPSWISPLDISQKLIHFSLKTLYNLCEDEEQTLFLLTTTTGEVRKQDCWKKVFSLYKKFSLGGFKKQLILFDFRLSTLIDFESS